MCCFYKVHSKKCAAFEKLVPKNVDIAFFLRIILISEKIKHNYGLSVQPAGSSFHVGLSGTGKPDQLSTVRGRSDS